MMIKSFGTNQIWHKSTMMIFTEKSNDDNKRIRNKERKKTLNNENIRRLYSSIQPYGCIFWFLFKYFYFFCQILHFFYSASSCCCRLEMMSVCVFVGKCLHFQLFLSIMIRIIIIFFVPTSEYNWIQIFSLFFSNSYFNNSKLFVSQLNDSIFWLWQ